MNLHIIIYLLFVYGCALIMIQGEGPFGIIEKFRNKVDSKLFRCPLCFSTNVGWVVSLIDTFLLKGIAFTPFNLLYDNPSLFFVGMIMDAGIAAAGCYILWNINDYIDKITPYEE